MKPKPSPLQILDIALTELNFNFVPPPNNDKVSDYYYSKYSIDIDFMIQANDYLMVYMKAEVNHVEKPLPGYSFIAEAACVFDLNEKLVKDSQAKNDIEGYSTLYIALNSLRGLISNFTANAPWGRYILPSVDLNDLIEKKRLSLNEQKETSKKSSGSMPVVRRSKKKTQS